MPASRPLCRVLVVVALVASAPRAMLHAQTVPAAPVPRTGLFGNGRVIGPDRVEPFRLRFALPSDGLAYARDVHAPWSTLGAPSRPLTYRVPSRRETGSPGDASARCPMPVARVDSMHVPDMPRATPLVRDTGGVTVATCVNPLMAR